MTDCGDTIKFARENAGFLQREFAEKLGISAQYMSDLESNRRNLSPAMADRIHQTLEKCSDAYDGSEYARLEWYLLGAQQAGWGLLANTLGRYRSALHRIMTSRRGRSAAALMQNIARDTLLNADEKGLSK